MQTTFEKHIEKVSKVVETWPVWKQELLGGKATKTMQTNQEEKLFVEKYRPKRVDDCILPTSLKKSFKDIIKSNTPQNLLLSGGAGCGKTTVAKALCDELGVDWILINASEQSGIDVVRNQIRNFASTVSLSGGQKVVILDEFDYSNSQSMQPALRGFIEEFSTNCNFIITCNFKNRIIAPIHSRCTCIEFIIPQKQKIKLAAQFIQRVGEILDNEKIKYNEKVVAKLVMSHFPDFRRVLNEIQRYSVAGEIDIGILSEIGEINVGKLCEYMKQKNFRECRQWVVDNLDNDISTLFRKLYDGMKEFVNPQSIPDMILILNEYQYKSAFVADLEINMAACVVELMMNVEFK